MAQGQGCVVQCFRLPLQLPGSFVNHQGGEGFLKAFVHGILTQYLYGSMIGK
jgi:hypothetical protein